ncbi:MAG TPA: GFA family protein [Kofleriaceae bacterium]|nr:GFA family protein [Kofleriaceae bacterium]
MTTTDANATHDLAPAEEKLRTGSCHCGAVRYQATMKLEGLMTCNCSICGRTGSILAFIPADKFELLAGEESLTDYQFNRHVIHHLFCKVCGVRPFARGAKPDGTPMVAVNVRCLDGVDPFALPAPKQFEGRKL